MPQINVLIKPASSNCNLRCKYCFYYDVSANRDNPNYGMMSYETLEELVKKVFEFGEHYVGFSFQGGEPTLAGLDFYRKLIELEKKYNTKRIKVGNLIQTNGFNINENWGKFLAENNFLVGLSLDGPKEIHDINRVDSSGNASHKRIEKTVDIFNKYKVEYNILCVVTKLVARHVEKVYKYYSKKGFRYLQFIPCLDEIGVKPGKNSYSLTSEDYGKFLKKLFDLWYRDFLSGKRISIRMFDNILQMLFGYTPESCDMRGCCSVNIVLEADGSVYPCDFYVLDEWKMGYIQNNTLMELLQSEAAKAFVGEIKGTYGECSNCEFKSICRGGCKRHYESFNGDKYGRNYFCSSYKEFYRYTLPRFYEIARTIKSSI